MSKPRRQFITRHAYQTVQDAFAAAGIEMATPEARVVFDDDEEDATGNRNLPAR